MNITSKKSALSLGLILALIFIICAPFFPPLILRLTSMIVTIIFVGYIFYSEFYCSIRDNNKMTLTKFIRVISVIILLVVLIFGLIFKFNSDFNYGPFEHGGKTYALGYLDSFYFSFLNFFSSTYGDYVPLGWSKIVSVIEIFIGKIFLIIFIGLAISRDILSTKRNKNGKN